MTKAALSRTFPLATLLLAMLTGGLGCAISEKQEIDMGREAAPQFEKEFGGLYPDPEVQQYVHEVGTRMTRYTGRPDLPWQFRVVNSKQINAFALPGGYIYMTKGLLFNLKDEAQLASILGHEAGHVAHRDTVHQLQRQQVIQGGLGLAGIFAGSTVADIGQLVVALGSLKYSRDQEKNADMAGLSYIAKAGYDPRAMVQVMQILQNASGGGGAPDFLSSHPNPGNREQYLAEQIQKDYGNIISSGRTGEAEFAQRVLGRSGRQPGSAMAPSNERGHQQSE